MSTTYRGPAVPAEIAAAAVAQIRRRMAGRSAGELAAEAGVSKAAVTNLLAGRNAPALGTLCAIAGAIGCHPADLLRDPAPVIS